MKLTRKEITAPLVDAQEIVMLTGAGEKAVEGKLCIPLAVGLACYSVLFDPRLLQEMCQAAGFQPAGFRINKMDPAELFVQFVRFVQKSGLGVGPLIETIDDAAFDLAESEPMVFKMNLLQPPHIITIHDPDAECWAAATWLKVRSGTLDESTLAKFSEACQALLQEPAASNRPPAPPQKLLRDPSVEKVKEKVGEWRERALEAEKSLESTRSARNAFEKELRDAKAELRMLRNEVGRLQEELAGRVSAQRIAEERCAALQANQKEARTRIASLEEELAKERAKSAAGSGAGPVPPEPLPQENDISTVYAKIERLQKTVESLSGRLNESLLAPGRRPPASRGSERVMAFIDVANLDCAATAYFGKRVNYEMLGRYLSSRTPTGRSRLCENIAFLCTEQRSGADAFAQYLRSLGYRTVTRPLKVFSDGSTKGNVDVLLAVYAMKHVDDLDTAVIVSGDGDFAAVAEFFRSYGKRVEVLSFQNLGYEMRAVVDEVVELDNRILLSGPQQEILWTQQR